MNRILKHNLLALQRNEQIKGINPKLIKDILENRYELLDDDIGEGQFHFEENIGPRRMEYLHKSVLNKREINPFDELLNGASEVIRFYKLQDTFPIYLQKILRDKFDLDISHVEFAIRTHPKLYFYLGIFTDTRLSGNDLANLETYTQCQFNHMDFDGEGPYQYIFKY